MVRVNGETRQRDLTSDMANRIPQLVEFVSSVCTLVMGGNITCGTNHQGLGPVQNGDRAELTIERLGTLAVDVRDPSGPAWERPIDERIAKMVQQM